MTWLGQPPEDLRRRRGRFTLVGNSPGLMIAVIFVCAVLVVLRIATSWWLVEDWYADWRAAEPAALPRDLPRPTVQPRPIGDAGAWFGADDYPTAALRASEQGTVRVTMLIDERGRPTGCEIVTSSGSDALDRETCRIAVRRGLYAPARDRQGRPVRAILSMPRVRWVIPDNSDAARKAGPVPG